MINEITINSNNTIQMSRGQLLNWINQLLKVNLTKIQQLGTGAIYCQLIDIIYPGKIQLSKINWKAKFEYQFVANFKVLQQSFTKLGIIKNIEVQKLIKCKYQDNLQFLQWFKKIFDQNGITGKQYNALQKRGDVEDKKKQKQNRPTNKQYNSNLRSQIAISQVSFQSNDRQSDDAQKNSETINDTSLIFNNPHNTPIVEMSQDWLWKQQMKDNIIKEERQFYLKKFKQIQHLFEEWNTEKTSAELIQKVRKIILMPPAMNWKVVDGQLVQIKEQIQIN